MKSPTPNTPPKALNAPPRPATPENDPNLMYRRFVAWTALPKPKDAPQTMQEFMFRHSLTTEDLAGFMARPSFPDDVGLKAAAHYRTKLPELLESAFQTARLSGSVTDAARFTELLQAVERPRGASVGNINNFFVNLTDDQYKRILEREARLLETRSAE